MSVSPSRIFDEREMLERLGGDQALMVEVIGMFLDESPGLLAAIREAAVARDAKALRMAAHTMKGALLNISAAPAAGKASAIEEQAALARLEGTADMVSGLEETLGRLEDELELIAARQ